MRDNGESAGRERLSDAAQPSTTTTWPTTVRPTEPRVPQAGEMIAGKKPTLWRRTRAAVADISERTRLVVTWGGALIIAGALFYGGAAWNEFRGAIAKNAEQDVRIAKMEDRFTSIEKTLTEINERQKNQGEPIATIGRLSQYQVELLRDLETALAKQGIETEKHGP